MIRRVLISSTAATATAFAMFSAPVLAQSNNDTASPTVDKIIVREDVPVQKQVIIANSPQDLALQEEIRKIKAYNAKVDRQVGISGNRPTEMNIARSPTVIAKPVTRKFQGNQIKLFKEDSAKLTYSSEGNKRSSLIPTTVVVRRPVAGYTRIHRVAEKDTLYNLAARNCITVANIKAQNELMDSNIQIGQVLTLPTSQCASFGDARTIPTSDIKTNTEAGVVSSNTLTRQNIGVVRRVMPIQTGIKVREGNAYAVLPKDSLYSIGKRYCLSAGELAEFNSLKTSNPIQPGQILRLPNSACGK